MKGEADIGAALDAAKAFPEVIGVLIVLGRKLGVWGDVDLMKV